MAGGIRRSCANFHDQFLVEYPFQVPLQTAAVDGRAERLEILDGQLAVLNEVAQRLGLAVVQAVLLDQHVAADDLLAAFAHFDHLGFQAGDEVIEPAGHVHAVFAHALDRPVEGRPVAVVVFADGKQPFKVVPGFVKAEGGEQARGAGIIS